LAEGLTWPPIREDLERLYLAEKLSAAKIARVYGLRYKNDRVAGSTVLYYLRRNRIKRRNPAEHLRRVTGPMVDNWISRYRGGESLKRIAGDDFSPATVLMHLRRAGIQLRDKTEAQIQAVSKYERKPFQGDRMEKAYLMGLRYGDLNAVRHGRGIRLRVSTTHPAMASLFESIFSPYGHVLRYPRTAPFTEYEWTLEADLDSSFEFLLEKPSVQNLEHLTPSEFKSFLSGLFDAEGTIYLHRRKFGACFEFSIPNGDSNLIELVSGWLHSLGHHPRVDSRRQNPLRLGYFREGSIFRVSLFRKSEVCSLLRTIRPRHPEKVRKRDFVCEHTCGTESRIGKTEIRDWEGLTLGVRNERDLFVEQARLAMQRG